jgi:transcriptional regulator with XRE-family HTH domain
MQAKLGGRKRRGGPHPVDIHVGMRLRQRRTALGISQPELAAALGIAYQQLYKYEQAKNRISASRLYELSEVLDVPVTFFFEGIAGTDAEAKKPKLHNMNFPKER